MNDVAAQAVAWVRQEPGMALLAAGGAYLFLLALVIVLLVRFAALSKKQARLLRGADGHSIERMLLEHADTRHEIESQLAEARQSGTSNTAALRLCLQKVGMVRYDAFPDVGGEQSFSLALLDAENSGLILSGLFSRHDMRVYAKPVSGGVSSLALTPEEEKALHSARIGGPEMTEAGRAANGRR
jgi:hypothetical protein